MRQVQLKEEDNKITFVDQVSEQKYYGVLIDKEKYFVMKKDRSHYKFINPDNILNCIFDSHNGYYEHLINIFKFCMKTYSYQVFEFNTSKELFKWLSE